MPALFVGPPSWWVGRVSMAVTFFPPHSGSVHPLQTPCPREVPAERSRLRYLAHAGAPYAPSDGRVPVPAPAEQWVRPWQCRVPAEPVWTETAESWQRRCRSRSYTSRHSHGSDRHRNASVGGIVAHWHSHSAGNADHWDADAVPATGCWRYRPSNPLSENRLSVPPSVQSIPDMRHAILARLHVGST